MVSNTFKYYTAFYITSCLFSVFLHSIRKSISPPRTPVSHSSASSPLSTAGRGEGGATISKHGQFMLRAPHPQASELYYQDHRFAYDTPHYQPTCESVFLIRELDLNVLLLLLCHCQFFHFLSSRSLQPIYTSHFSQTLHGSLPPVIKCPRILFATFHWPVANFLPQ